MERERCKTCGRFLSTCSDLYFATYLNPRGLFCSNLRCGMHFCLYAHISPKYLGE